MVGKQNQKLNIKQRSSCAVGTVFNDLFRQMGMSFAVSFLMKVAELPPYQVGLAMLIMQGTDAFISPINGYLSDQVKIPFAANKMGRRKAWHLVGAILLAVGVPLLFNRCLFCSANTEETWQPLVYYGFALVLIALGYNMMEITHLAIISTVTDTFRELTAVNSLRTVFSFLSGIYVYLIAWGLLGQDSADDLTPSNQTQFQRLSLIATGTGIIFSIIFYIGTKEPEAFRRMPSLRKISTLVDPVNVGGLLSAGQSIYSMAFGKIDEFKTESATLAQSFIEILMSAAKSEESSNDPREETETEVVQRKRSVLQRFVTALFSSKTNESNLHDSPGDLQLVEVNADGTMEGPSDLVRKVQTLNQERKKSLVMRFIYGLVDVMRQNQPNETDTIQGYENKYVENDESKEDCRKCSFHQDCNANSSVRRTGKGDDSKLESESKGRHKNARQRKSGVVLALEDTLELRMANLGHQNHSIEVEVHVGSDGESDFIHNNRRPSEEDIPSTEEAKTRKGSFFQEQHRSGGPDEEVNFSQETSHVDLSVSSEKENQKIKGSIMDDHDNEAVRTKADEDSIDIVICKPEPNISTPKKKPKTMKDWLMSPHLYKVAVTVTCSRLVQDAVYAYLPLYLTERLGFAVQAIAYFPLVLLGSAALASIFTERLNTKIGSKWTYILACLFVIGGSVYCFFQTPSLRQSTYIPVVMIGTGMSIMYVMSLALATELVGQDKESSGSALSVIVIIARLSSGGLFMTVQQFYPENSVSNSAAVSDYVRYILSMVPGLLAFTGFMVVLFFQSSSFSYAKKEPLQLLSKEADIEAKEGGAQSEVINVPDREREMSSMAPRND